MYWCIAIHSVAIHVSIQQNGCRYIDPIVEATSASSFKLLHDHYGDGHGFIAT